MAIGLAVNQRHFKLSITELEAKMTKLNESSSQTFQDPHIEDGISSIEGGNKKIFDTGDIYLSLDDRTVSLIQKND